MLFLAVLGAASPTFGMRSISELNATGRQFKLYFETRSFPVGDVLNTVIYRAKNQRKVAIGRIFMDPLHPGHYALYLRSRGMFYIPITGLFAGPIAAHYGICKLIDTLTREPDDARSKKEPAPSGVAP